MSSHHRRTPSLISEPRDANPGLRTSGGGGGGGGANPGLPPECPLGLEPLEPRMLLAATIAINFQPSGAAVPPGYLVDSGAVFASRNNGYTYGWNALTTATRDRNSSRSPDQRYDTLNHMQQYGSRTWEIALPNGLYTVKLVAGDPSYTDSIYKINAESTLLINGTPSSTKRWITNTATVSVTDGRLTLANATGAKNNKINFIEITQVAPTDVHVKNFGAIGDGVTDDSAAIQNAINQASAGSTLVFEPRVYKLNRGLVIDKPLNLAGNGGTLLLNTSAYPQNQSITLQSRLATQQYQWTQPVTKGQTSFAVAAPDLKPGDNVFISLGQDPHDPNEEHYGSLARILTNTGSSVTLDISVPYNIVHGSKLHQIRRIESLIENVTVQDLRFDHVAGTVPNVNVYVAKSRNVAMENLSGRFTILANVVDSQNVSLQGVTGQLTSPHAAAGRVLSAWQSDGVTATEIHVSTAVDKPVVFLESWTRNTTIRNITVDWDYTSTPKSGIFHLSGGSYGTFIDNAVIRNQGPIILAGSGTQPSEFQFGRVDVSGSVKSAPLWAMSEFVHAGRQYSQQTTTTKTINLLPNWTGQAVTLGSGLVKSAEVYISTTSGVDKIYLLNQSYTGSQIQTSLLAGQTVQLRGFGSYGTDYPFNDPASLTKLLHIYTGSAVPSGVVLTVALELYV